MAADLTHSNLVQHAPVAASAVGTFAHQALIYESVDEFVDAAAPFLREGIEREQPTLVRVRRAGLDALREALGQDVAQVDLHVAEEWYENPIRTRHKFARWTSHHGSDGRRVRLLGEPPWPLGFEAGIREWARYEAILNLTFAGLPVSLACAYDAGALPAEVIDHAVSTHPETLTSAGIAASERFVDPAAYCRRLDGQASLPTASPTAELSFGRRELPAVRRLVSLEAVRAGLGGHKVDDLVVAVNEIATNAIVHGKGPASLRIWRRSGELVCEVADHGAGLDDPLTGQLPPDLQAPGGWGVWMARLVSDALEARSDPSGNRVVVRAWLPPSAPHRRAAPAPAYPAGRLL
jgi:anti-sigma regulatory factor (Ser/Thr protein kinase)